MSSGKSIFRKSHNKNVELYRRGNQISVRLLTSIPTDYQITENLAAQTLVVKFKKARTGFTDGRMERLFNDRQLSGIRFQNLAMKYGHSSN